MPVALYDIVPLRVLHVEPFFLPVDIAWHRRDSQLWQSWCCHCTKCVKWCRLPLRIAPVLLPGAYRPALLYSYRDHCSARVSFEGSGPRGIRSTWDHVAKRDQGTEKCHVHPILCAPFSSPRKRSPANDIPGRDCDFLETCCRNGVVKGRCSHRQFQVPVYLVPGMQYLQVLL